MDTVWLALLGLAAGALTTVAGLGGGLVLTLVLSAFVGPQAALAYAAPALLLGNMHRVLLLRKHIDLRFVLPFVLGAVPGALVGGFLAVSLPEWVLQLLLTLTFVYALLKQIGVVKWTPNASAQVPLAFAVGLLTASSGGGGLILGPLLIATGARGPRFVVSASLIATSVHITRLAAYGAGGLLSMDTLWASLIIALAIIAGNIAGKRVSLNDARRLRVTYGVLVVCGVAALLGYA